MLVYFSLIPVLHAINTKNLILSFQSKYGGSYHLSDINEENGNITGTVTFTKTKVDEFKLVWKERKGSLQGVDVIVREMKKKHSLELDPYGILKIVLERPNKRNIEFIKGEMKEAYDDILLSFIDRSSELGYSFPQEIAKFGTGVSAIGEGIKVDSLSYELDQRLEEAHKSTARIILTKVNDTKKEISRSKFPFVLRKGYSNFLDLHNLLSDKKILFSLLSTAIEKITIGLSGMFRKAWEATYSHSKMIFEYFSTILNNLEFILNVYSDHLGVVGIYANIIALGFGLFLSAFASPLIVGVPTGIVGLFALVSGSLFWKRTGTKDLISRGLDMLHEYATIGVGSV